MAVTQTARSRRGQLGLRAVSAPVAERFQISQWPPMLGGGGSRRNAVRRPMAGADFASRGRRGGDADNYSTYDGYRSANEANNGPIGPRPRYPGKSQGVAPLVPPVLSTSARAVCPKRQLVHCRVFVVIIALVYFVSYDTNCIIFIPIIVRYFE